MNEQGGKVVLPRLEPDQLWETLARHYAGKDPRRWKRLAMVALHEEVGWPLSYIARLFGHHKGHVSRLVEKTKRELRERFLDGRTAE